jgi:hypothetical protein
MASGARPSRATVVARTLVDMGSAMARRTPLHLDDRRHPLAPAALRVERSTARTDRGIANQTALTVWFGEGPPLPSVVNGGTSMRTVVGTVAGLAGVVALGALGFIASQRDVRRLPEASPLPLLQPPAE